jgi:predicted nuclease of predicted toxin-antitoxin system
MLIALLADENFPFPVVLALRQYGYDVKTILDLGIAGQAIPDDDVLVIATQQNRCLITLNRKDFIKLHRERIDHAGILISTFDADFTALARRIDQCLQETGSSAAGLLLRVQRSA